jgi:hypothetical protein
MTRIDGIQTGTNIADGIVQGGLRARVASAEQTVHSGECVECAGVFLIGRRF